MAAVAGYTGMMIASGLCPPTYGFAAWYNPYIGTFGRGAAVCGPYGGAGGFAAYYPRTGTYARGGVADGPYDSDRRIEFINDFSERKQEAHG
jgi:hypothetical protein